MKLLSGKEFWSYKKQYSDRGQDGQRNQRMIQLMSLSKDMAEQAWGEIIEKQSLRATSVR